jgi:hypothetical protein
MNLIPDVTFRLKRASLAIYHLKNNKVQILARLEQHLQFLCQGYNFQIPLLSKNQVFLRDTNIIELSFIWINIFSFLKFSHTLNRY